MRLIQNSAGIALLALVAYVPMAAATVTNVSLFKNLVYAQTSSAQPSSPTGTFFSAGLDETATTDSTGAAVTYAGPGSPLALTKTGTNFFGAGSFATAAAMDTAYPFGSPYTFAISGGTLGTQSSAVATPSTGLYAATTPFLTGSSYAATQGLNATASTTLNYNGFSTPAGASEAFTFVFITRVSDNVSVYSAGFLSPGTTSFTIGANTLAANTAYNIDLDFSGRLSGTAFGALSTIGFDRRTQIAFTTATPEPASLVLLGFGAAFVLRRRSASSPTRR